MTFTPQELALLKLSDQAEEVETEQERAARWSRESRARRIAREGEAFRARERANSSRYHKKHKETK